MTIADPFYNRMNSANVAARHCRLSRRSTDARITEVETVRRGCNRYGGSTIVRAKPAERPAFPFQRILSRGWRQSYRARTPRKYLLADLASATFC